MLAEEYGVTVCTFGDLRWGRAPIPAWQEPAKGAKVQVVYAPMDAVDYAKNHPGVSRSASCRWGLKPPLPHPAWRWSWPKGRD